MILKPLDLLESPMNPFRVLQIYMVLKPAKENKMLLNFCVTTNLHGSQTRHTLFLRYLPFWGTTNLHGSQTSCFSGVF